MNKTEIYGALKRIYAALLILNTAVIFIVVYLAISGYMSQKKTITEMGYTLLRAFEATRPRIFFTGENQHLNNILEEMFDLDTINNIVIYRMNGDPIFYLRPHKNIIRTDIYNEYKEENKNEIIIYNSFHIMHRAGLQHNRTYSENHHSDFDKIFIAISINKKHLQSIWNYSFFAITAALIAEIIILFLYRRIKQVIKLYEQSIIKLKDSEKEAASGRLASVLAHEIKNPLSSLNGLLSYASEKCNDDKINELIDKAAFETERLSDIVNDFLTYGRSVELQLSNIHIRNTINKTIEILNHDAESKNIIFDITNNDFIIEADESKFLQIFVNIILNAIDASPKNGTIKIIIDEKILTVSICNDTEKQVTDNNKFFEPFYTTKTKGSGLGLSITKRLVELHGYNIYIEQTSPFIIVINFRKQQ